MTPEERAQLTRWFWWKNRLPWIIRWLVCIIRKHEWRPLGMAWSICDWCESHGDFDKAAHMRNPWERGERG